jgi:hypothetical protein
MLGVLFYYKRFKTLYLYTIFLLLCVLAVASAMSKLRAGPYQSVAFFEYPYCWNTLLQNSGIQGFI